MKETETARIEVNIVTSATVCRLGFFPTPDRVFGDGGCVTRAILSSTGRFRTARAIVFMRPDRFLAGEDDAHLVDES